MKDLRTPVLSALEEYAASGVVNFDVPGHKKRMKWGQENPFWDEILYYDYNSTKELDLLSNPTGVIAESEKLMGEAYGADQCYFLVNGSTFGILAMIMAAINPGEKILLPRNVHKSVINGVILSGASPIFVEPEIDYEFGVANGVPYSKVEKMIRDHPDIRAVFLINPTYFGVTSDLTAIIELCHANQILVLVDEAHGAHFPFHPDFPPGAMAMGADMSTASVHKTCGSLTQSSILLLNERFISRKKVKTTLNLIQTTSPSYLLMASLDLARKKLVGEGEELYDRLLGEVRMAREAIGRIAGLQVMTPEYVDTREGRNAFDETKLVIRVNGLGLTGFEVYDLLKADYNIQVELAETYVILAVVGPGDDWETLQLLVDALSDISRRFYGEKQEFEIPMSGFFEKPMTVVSPRNAFYSPKKWVHLDEAEGEVCGESIMIYPPGIPLIIPGEKITRNVIEHYRFYQQQHCTVLNNDEDPEVIMVLGE